MNRKDFRPSSSSSSISEKDRQTIRDNYRPHKQKAVGDKNHVIGVFINGNGRTRTANNSLHTDGNKLYSYNTVIATHQKDGSFLINNTKYSKTTTTQQNELIRALKGRGEKYAVTGGKERGYEGEDLSESEEQRKFKELNKESSEQEKESYKPYTSKGSMSLSEIKRENERAGQYFFSPSTMRLYRQVNARYRVKYDKNTDTNYVIVNMKTYPESSQRRDVVYKFNRENGHLDIQN